MRIFRHYEHIPAPFQGAVVAIGNFDGVHRGHQALIAQARMLAEERAAPLGVLAFEPHPQEFFHPASQNFRLTPFRSKARLLAEQGVDVLYALPFDAAMAAMSAQQFVIDVLVEGLGVGGVVIGGDFQFGKGRAGNATLLAYMGEMEEFGVHVLEPVLEDGAEKISSTHIREALKAGHPQAAARLLGHNWFAESRVERGDARGRTIGVPTANMRLTDCIHPKFGVYAVRATVFEDDKPVLRRDGVANFGIRPMWKTEEPLLETWLFDFDGDLYGKHMAVDFVHYLRGEEKFDGIDALKAQIAQDAEAAREILAR